MDRADPRDRGVCTGRRLRQASIDPEIPTSSAGLAARDGRGCTGTCARRSRGLGGDVRDRPRVAWSGDSLPSNGSHHRGRIGVARHGWGTHIGPHVGGSEGPGSGSGSGGNPPEGPPRRGRRGRHSHRLGDPASACLRSCRRGLRGRLRRPRRTEVLPGLRYWVGSKTSLVWSVNTGSMRSSSRCLRRVGERHEGSPNSPGAQRVECRILPGITQVLSGDATLAGVRPVQVEDLLRREPIELDLPASYIDGRTILVTGAGGSIGSELVRQTALLEPANIILFGHGETALHRIHEELLFSMPEQRTTVVIGDVRDRAKIDHVMRTFQPSVVFHAAAHKHVPLMEADPDEAVLNNVGGTRNLASAALEAGVERFVNVSTDKAVRPTSMLGATKSLAELVVRTVAGEADEGQSFVSVRFGNVLGSRGSVVEAFQEQIRRGGPVRLTDPEMSRYFMTIREASQLVVQSGALGRERGGVRARYGYARSDRGSGPRHDPPCRDGRRRDPDRLHGETSWRETPRGAVRG